MLMSITWSTKDICNSRNALNVKTGMMTNMRVIPFLNFSLFGKLFIRIS